MYNLKNYLLSMQSHWMINQPLYESVQESLPQIAKFRARRGTEDLERLAVSQHIKKVFPDVYKVPLLRRQYCKMLVEEIRQMQKDGLFETNPNEDVLRQIPEITLHDMVPELYRTMWFIVQNVLNPIFFSLYQRDCAEVSSIQLANYNVKDNPLNWLDDVLGVEHQNFFEGRATAYMKAGLRGDMQKVKFANVA